MFQTNADFAVPVVEEIAPDISSVRDLESICTPPRLTRLYQLEPGTSVKTSRFGTEFLLIHGSCYIENQHFHDGYYLRFHQSIEVSTQQGCLIFEKSSQHQPGDYLIRKINTKSGHLWLPGPVQGITICPLHVFNSESIMLLRWLDACAFKPRLDPQGEEILIIEGQLRNRDSSFTSLTWLRNPVEDWRWWHGTAGTLLYYKSGHFPV